jgi:nitroreductase
VRESELVRSLRQVRNFSDQAIPDDILLDILNAGRWTGSSKNSQPWDLIVVQKHEVLVALSKLGQFAGHVAGAKLGIGLVMHGKDDWTLMDEGRLMQNIMLAAWGHGVGSGIGSIYPDDNEERAKVLLGIPKDLSLRTVLSIGYPESPEALRLPPTARSRGRRPLEDVVSWERFGNHIL